MNHLLLGPPCSPARNPQGHRGGPPRKEEIEKLTNKSPLNMMWIRKRRIYGGTNENRRPLDVGCKGPATWPLDKGGKTCCH
ncbi:MAG: hypothetical protein C0392_14775 [Syntrophus sp. (in: bacteria)]|nr:hypothetical protein [Syntrophus sp. (in: bacteria)]